MHHEGLTALSFFVVGLGLFGVPILLGLWRGFGSKWGAIAVSTLVSPFLILGGMKLTANVYWHFNRDPLGGGCPGGECGAASYAAGLWPLLIPVFMVPSFVISLVLILLIRKFRT